MTKKKIIKPATEAQKRARERNWNKRQILGIRALAHGIYLSKTTTAKEKSFLSLIEYDLDMILRDWNRK